MNRGAIVRRLAKLEEARRVDPVVLHFEDWNKTPMRIDGSAKNFRRLMSVMEEYHRPGVRRMQGALLELDLVRRAARIEGPSASLFSLLQSIAQDPVPDQQ